MPRDLPLAAMIVLVLTSLAIAPGCRREAGIDMRWGAHREHMAAPADAVADATRQSIAESNLQLIEESQRGDTTRFVARTAFDHRVRISVTDAGAESTRVGVRVTGEAEGLRLQILNDIRERLAGLE